MLSNTYHKIIFFVALTITLIGNAQDKVAPAFSNVKVNKNEGVASNFNYKAHYLNSNVNLDEKPSAFSIENLAINTALSEISPTIYKNNLLFSSIKTANNKAVYKRDINYYKFYTAPLVNLQQEAQLVRFATELKTVANENSCTFSKDGNTMYFTANAIKGEKKAKKTITHKIYKATLVEDKWANIIALPFNSNEYSNAHPALNAKGTKLYFASNMPGTKGEADIFYVDINTDGTYGTPVNVQQVNTIKTETTPFISSNNTLYFASDGQDGLGSLDVYAIEIDEIATQTPLNLGAPINSVDEDFGFTLHNKKGYFVSNRTGGKGEDDIYAVTQIDELPFLREKQLTVSLKDSNTQQPIAGATTLIIDENGSVLATGVSDQQGIFKATITTTHEHLTVKNSAKNYADKLKDLDFSNTATNIDITLTPNKPLVDLSTIKINPVLFNFDSYTLSEENKASLQNLATILKENKDAKLKITGQTDYIGNQDYNLQLSKKRAESIANYLVSIGISKERVLATGIGETQPLNNCKTKACTAKNRRAELSFINN